VVRQLIASGSPFEDVIGFSRAVRAGNYIAVSGTAPIDAQGHTVSPGNLGEQARACLRLMLAAIEAGGGTAQQVIRTRIMLTDIAQWREAAAAHAEVFGKHKPACTFVEVSRFINADWLVETEADCVLE
jgi:enamine deaminase RidA (YjgF/YER057c/UK114 family)